MKKFINYWIPVILWSSFIFYLSGIPYLQTNLGIWDLILRKSAHVTEYAVLFLLLLRAINSTVLKNFTLSRWVAISFSILYAVSDEFHQSFIPGRSASPIDVCIDAIGPFTALLLLFIFEAKK